MIYTLVELHKHLTKRKGKSYRENVLFARTYVEKMMAELREYPTHGFPVATKLKDKMLGGK